MAEESVDDDYKNIIDDIIKNEDEDKLNSLVKEANLDSSLIDYILLNGEEIEEWGDYGSLVCHKDLNLANKRSIIDHEGDLFICDNNGKKLILLTTTFHKEEFKCCIKNHTCTKELLIEIVKKILNNISEFENADELLKLVAQHPNADDEFEMTIKVMNLCNSIEPEIDINYDEFVIAYQNINNFNKKIDGTYWWEVASEIYNSINSSLSVVGKTPENCSFDSFAINDYKENEKYDILLKMSKLNLLEISDDGFVTINDTNWDPEYNDCDTEDEKQEFVDLISEFMDGDFFKQNLDCIKTPFWLSIHTYNDAFVTKILYFNGKKLFKYDEDNYDWFDVIERLKIQKEIISKKIINKNDFEIDLDNFEISDDYLSKNGPFDLDYITHLLIREFWEEIK